jgi:hypothetical protein
MPFLEPAPHRRPFHVHDLYCSITLTPRQRGGDLAITSLTVSCQSVNRYVIIKSVKDDEEEILLKAFVYDSNTLHLTFPHPLMVGMDRKLVIAPEFNNGGFIPATVVGYEWNKKDTITYLFGVGERVTSLFRRTEP